MTKLLKLEFKKIKNLYVLSLLLSIIYGGAMIIPYLSGYQYYRNIEIWDASNEIFTLIFPLIAVLPTCWLMYYERKDNFLIYTLSRVSKKKYIFSKYIVSACGGAMLVFFISFVGLIVALYFVPDVKPTVMGNDYALDKFFGSYFVNEPLLYGTVLSLWRACIGLIVVTFAFLLSLYVNNIFVILTSSFIYSILENFTLAILGMPYYRLVTSFSPNILSPSAITIMRLLVGPALFIVFIITTFAYFRWIKKEKVYST